MRPWTERPVLPPVGCAPGSDGSTRGRLQPQGVAPCVECERFSDALEADPAVIGRNELIRADASRASHAQLDASEELDEGDPIELGSLYADLLRTHPHVHVLGGCCGTDARHVDAIHRACVTAT